MNLDEWLGSEARELADLARLADGTEEALDELLNRGLDWLARVAPYDLAVVFELRGRDLRARAARGPLASQAVRRHAISLDAFPTIRLALEERRSRIFTEEDHAHGDGDPFDGLMNFPDGHACMVVPLVTGNEIFGIVSLDRAECVAYPRAVVDLVEVFGRLLALSVRCVRQGEALARAHAIDGERIVALDRHIEEMTEQAGVLESTKSAAVRALARQARLVASTTSTVLLSGETGTGKERMARYIHAASPRAGKPFVPVNCAALPASLLESELFGHERGAFTGAVRSRSGLFRAADGGTLFLDEVGEIPIELQPKLLRALQEGEVQPVGTDRVTKVDVRVVVATHVDLEAAVARGRFREDLYYRIAVYPIHLPPLRERVADLPDLCASLLADLAPRVGKKSLRLSKEAVGALARYPFPGNIRELSNLLERAAIECTGTVLEPEHLAIPRSDGRRRAAPPDDAPGEEPLVTLAEHERRYIARVLRATDGQIYGEGGAAAILGLPPTTLQSRMKKLGVKRTED